MEFHTIQSISVCSLNVYYVQTCNVIHHKPLQTSRFPPHLSAPSSLPARSQPSVGAFCIYLETAEQILSQCSLSQLLWLPARGFIPAQGLCWVLAAICRLSRGFVLGLFPAQPDSPNPSDHTLPSPRLTKPLWSHPAISPKIIVWPGGKWLGIAEGGKAALEELLLLWGVWSCEKEQNWGKKLWVCLQELKQTEPKPANQTCSNREENSVFGVKQQSSESEKEPEVQGRFGLQHTLH